MAFNARLKCLTFVVSILAGNSLLAADPAHNVHDAAQQAIEYNPQVQAAWHAFKASDYQVDEARGGYYPSVDLSASTGKASRDFDNRDRYGVSQAQISLSQLLFDGFKTTGQVDRVKGERLVRYYQLLDAVEATALDSVTAFEDVARERELMSLAKDNYAKHLEVFAQIDERVKSGVGRKVDLEQVAGRLALAESNMLTEASNLHDVTARYLRIVGNLPASTVVPSGLSDSTLPSNIRETLILAYQGNPGFHAAVKNIAAAEAGVTVERSGYYPKAELRARQSISRNLNGFDDRFDPETRGKESAVELALTYNLFAGGSNRAAVRRSLEDVNQAKDLRDKACVDLRQTTQIAFNDSQRIREQLTALAQHRSSSDKVRVAYGEQFRIGQRSLLDMLDAENEYFQAGRAYVTAEHDLNVAHARTLEAMGQLLPALKLARDKLTPVKDADLSDDTQHDGKTACPIDSDNQTFARKDLVSDLMRISTDTLFATGKSVLNPNATQKLDELVEQAKAVPNVVLLTVSGHADSTGNDAINVPLSKARAEAVRNYFILHGLEKISIQTEGYGSSRPIADNATEEGKATNRRVEIVITHQR